MYVNVSTIFYQSKVYGKNDFAEKIILLEPKK